MSFLIDTKVVLEAFWIMILPLIFSNILHMIVVKRSYLHFLTIPINRKLFGTNKTYRGFLVLSFFTALFSGSFSRFILSQGFETGFWFGFALGFSYALFELPNSLYKRWKGMKSGKLPSKDKYFHILLDKTDSAFGVSMAYYLLTEISILEAGVLFIISALLHFSISILLVKTKLKASL